ncbi:hypothetical protein [uncultured Psychrobacter sp.]|uniref:hypothetical protein n=1 Tax=uncultured Psychrobacter sp. TaxID=259303 RepID=UPI0025992936|nr:hypothetical protein [uncultured Psychrobacter sp.]
MSKYIAKQTIGDFAIGDEVKGLSDERIKQLVELDAVTVEEVKQAAKPAAKTVKKD